MTPNLHPYPAYKPSGIEWLGEVPANWEIRRLKQICRLEYGDALAAEVRKDGVVPVLGSNGPVGLHNSANTKAPCIVIGRKGSFGKVNYSDNPVFAIDTTFFVDDRFSSADIRWLFFLFGWLRLDEITRDSAVPGLERKHAYQKLVMVPPHPEQTAIVRFLDHADRRIRRYLRAKEKLIALLEEQKQAVIQQAVTGRIDVRTGRPYPAYDDSGVEWLGCVPAHWDLRPAKWYFREVDERSETGSEELLSVSHITGVTPRSEKNVTMFKAESNVGHKLCRPGDLVVNTMWAWMAALGVSRQVGIVSPSYAVYRPHPSSRLLGDYADLLLRTTTYKNEYICRPTGIRSSRLRLYPEQFLRIKLLCPSPEEQRAIIEFASNKSANVRRSIDLTHGEISLLREYRTRLIADVVTGKLDVREAVAALPDVDPLAEEDVDDTIHAEADSNLEEHDAVKEVIL